MLVLLVVMGGTGWLYGGVDRRRWSFKLLQDLPISSVTPQYWTVLDRPRPASCSCSFGRAALRDAAPGRGSARAKSMSTL
jgi:hypothetical protein